MSISSYCPNCGYIFQSALIQSDPLTSSGHVALYDNEESCPNCGKRAGVVDGTFRQTKKGLEIIDAPPLTHAIFDHLKRIAEQADAGEISEDEAIGEVGTLAPKLAAFLQFCISIGLPVAGLLVSIVGLYAQFAGDRSSELFEQQSVALMKQQVETMKQVRDLSAVVYGKSVYDEGARPAKPKANAKAVKAKEPSKRRNDIKKKTKKVFKERRSTFGKARHR